LEVDQFSSWALRAQREKGPPNKIKKARGDRKGDRGGGRGIGAGYLAGASGSWAGVEFAEVAPQSLEEGGRRSERKTPRSRGGN